MFQGKKKMEEIEKEEKQCDKWVELRDKICEIASLFLGSRSFPLLTDRELFNALSYKRHLLHHLLSLYFSLPLIKYTYISS